MKDFVHIALETIDSTQTYAKQKCASFAKDKITCITAEEQTAGRGRFQRSWVSPPHVNLYITFVFWMPLPAPHLPSLSQILAFSLAQILLKKGLFPKLKWPNDVQLQGKKLAGILCETSFEKEEVAVYLGIGINVNFELAQAMQIDQPATSLLIETGKRWDRKELLQELQQEFGANLTIWQAKGFAPFHAAYEQILAYKGQSIRCLDGANEWVGICHSLTDEGQLNLLLADQTIQILRSGDLTSS